MKFKEAFEQMKKGKKVKLPSWKGYWEYDESTDSIFMHTKEGHVIEIRDTKKLSYTLENIISDEWMLADEENTPVLGGVATFGFGEAIKYLKRGFKVARKGWNGKNQYVELATCISYKNNEGEIVNVDHCSIGNKALAFVGTLGVQMGWLASQSDMLGEDWYIVEQGDSK